MAKKRAKQPSRRARRDWRQMVLLVISVLIVLSMVLALILTVTAPVPAG